MKKLMLTAAAAVMATGAFADMPAVYDYKATIKHMYLKEVNTSYNNGFAKVTVKIYQKYQKTATLKGYLIHDVLGATSAAAHFGWADPAIAAPITERNPQGPWNNKATPALGVTLANGPIVDKVNNRAFLVVMNQNAEAQVKAPKILPAVLEAKFFDTKYTMELTWPGPALQPKYTSGIAEGTLFVGGDLSLAGFNVLAPIDPAGLRGGVKQYLRDDRQDDLGINPTVASYDLVTAGGTSDNANGQIRALTAMLDYGWTSIYLFGKFNGANGSGFWPAAQAAISGYQVVPDAGGVRFYHDTWMNGVGVGKYGVVDDADACCGFQVGGVNFGLDTLAGKLKGGLFLCSENGYDVKTYGKLGGLDWEDQFWNEKAFSEVGLGAWGAPVGSQPRVYAAAGDRDQEDVWIDGDVELFTTDVLDGDWSIKRMATATVPTEPLTNAEIRQLSGLAALGANESYQATYACVAANVGNTDLDDLNATIKGCAWQLVNRSATWEFLRTTGTARTIPAIATQANNNRFTVPFIDGNFARAYGLGAYARGTF